MTVATRRSAQVRRHVRVRKTIAGTAARPRLAVFRSLIHIYAQLVDDATGRTLVSVSTLDAGSASGDAKSGNKSARASAAGKLLAERAQAAGVTEVVFDRAGYRYHGRVKALADAARQGGLKF